MRKHMRVERIKYPMGTLTAEGALIYDENVSGKRPAVLMAPNWMGMTDKAIERGEFVADNRYVVLLPTCMAPERDRPISARRPPWPIRCAPTPSSSAGVLKRRLR